MSTITRIPLALAMLSATPAFSAPSISAQESLPSVRVGERMVAPSVEQDSRVRITAPSLGLSEAVGTVQEATDDALVVQFEFPRRVGTVDRSDITNMEVSIQRERRVLKGLGVGLLVGAGGGVVLGLASGDDQAGFISFTAEEKAMMGAVALGLVGGVVGLIAGAAVRHDIWSPAVRPDVHVTVFPSVREHSAGLHVAFALRLH